MPKILGQGLRTSDVGGSVHGDKAWATHGRDSFHTCRSYFVRGRVGSTPFSGEIEIGSYPGTEDYETGECPILCDAASVAPPTVFTGG